MLACMSSCTRPSGNPEIELLVTEFLQRDLVSREVARQAKQLQEVGDTREALDVILAERNNRSPRLNVD